MGKTQKSESTKWLEQEVKNLSNGEQCIEIDSPEFQPVKNFSLIWNLFESYFFDKECNANKLWDNNVFHPKEEVTEFTFLFFKNRYTSEGETNYRFEALHFKSDFEKSTVIPFLDKSLCADAISIEEKERVCKMIIYRLRNNLFHGQKEIYNLKEQIELFVIADEFLISSIDNTVKSH